MRWLYLSLLAVASMLPLSADATAISSGKPFTLISVSHPGYVVSEVQGLGLVALSGSGTPLRLKIVAGNADPKCVSLESATDEGYFLRHQNSRVKLHPFPESDNLFAYDSTFYLVSNTDGTVSFRSYNYPSQYISVTAGNELYISTDPEPPSRSFTIGD